MLCFDLPFRKNKIDLLKHFASVSQANSSQNDFPKLMHVEDAPGKVCHHVTSQILRREERKNVSCFSFYFKVVLLIFLASTMTGRA